MTAKIRGPVVGFALFAVYAATVGHGVGWEDSAFLQLALATLGVPHGPGFPIFVLVGHVWTLPFGSAAAWGANLFSAAVMAVAGVFLLEIILELAALLRMRKAFDISVWEIASAIGVVMAWGMLPEIWAQAVRTEVYPLNLMVVLLAIWLALRANRQWQDDSVSSHRTALAAFWAWGMGMAIHPLVTFAAVTPWLVPTLWRWRRNGRGVVLAVLCAALPFTAYLYPLIRGRIDGVWAWGSFHDWGSIIDYYLRRSAWAAVPAGQNHYLENLRGWYFALTSAWPLLIWPALAVAIYWLRRCWSLLVAMVCVPLLVIWAAPFDQMNLDLWGYFLPFVAFVAACLGVFVVRSMAFLRSQFPALSVRSRQTFGYVAALILVGWPAVMLVKNQHIPSVRAGGADFVNSVVQTLPEGATLIAAEDNVLGVMTYAQQVEGLRPDLKVVAPGALRYPFYRQRVLKRFGSDVPASWSSHDVWTEPKWEHEVQVWLGGLSLATPRYTQFDALPGLKAEHLEPAGLLYQIADTTVTVAWEDAWDYWRDVVPRDIHDPVAADIYGRWTFNFGALAMHCGAPEVGWKALVAAVNRSGQNPEMYFLLGDALKRAGRMHDAMSMFSAACELAPYRGRYQQALALAQRPLAERP